MRFSDWSVISRPVLTNRRTSYLCRCKCGTERMVLENNLKRGVSKNCGCVRRETVGAINRSHGAGAARLAGSRAASVWLDMQKRCRAKSGSGLKYYASRNIMVCKRWSGKMGFINFLEDMGEPPSGKSIGRKNNNGNYSKRNCRWETPVQQQNNTSRNVFGWIRGKRRTAAQIASVLGKGRSVVARQIKKGQYGSNKT